MEKIIKNMRVTFDLLRRSMSLPDGVIIASVRQAENSVAEIILVDPDCLLPDECIYNADTKQWVASADKKKKTTTVNVEMEQGD